MVYINNMHKTLDKIMHMQHNIMTSIVNMAEDEIKRRPQSSISEGLLKKEFEDLGKQYVELRKRMNTYKVQEYKGKKSLFEGTTIVVDEEEAKKDDLLKKIIICEGPTDEVILQAIARKLNKKVNIVVANGKNHVPSIFATIKEKNQESSILIVVDSDGDEKETRQMIAEKIGLDGYEMVIINNSIEDWFMPRIKDFGKLKLMQSIDTIIEETDLNKLRAESPSFAKVEEFILK